MEIEKNFVRKFSLAVGIASFMWVIILTSFGFTGHVISDFGLVNINYFFNGILFFIGLFAFAIYFSKKN